MTFTLRSIFDGGWCAREAKVFRSTREEVERSRIVTNFEPTRPKISTYERYEKRRAFPNPKIFKKPVGNYTKRSKDVNRQQY